LNPPTNAIVLSVDEKSSVQALERTAPILPLREGIPNGSLTTIDETGTTTMFAALDTLTGSHRALFGSVTALKPAITAYDQRSQQNRDAVHLDEIRSYDHAQDQQMSFHLWRSH
jgi:hypothetical protein